MKTCKEAAEQWGISVRAVNDLCKRGRIPGALKEGRSWMIPDQAEKPEDKRVRSGSYVKCSVSSSSGKRPLPIGISDYIRAQSEYYYVDKTLLIRDILDRRALVTLFTRPRRFGKSLNMDMLRVFFELSSEDTSVYFLNKKIMGCGEKYMEHQGKYPVIFLTFKDVKYDSWEDALEKISQLLQEEFGRHPELADSELIGEYEKAFYARLVEGNANEVELSSSLQKLSKMLTEHYGTAPVIIIDEYDVPIQEAHTKDYFGKAADFMRVLFSGAFKDNRNLSFGFLTGILRIAQESIFSGLNNLSVSTVMDKEYDSFFGFTEAEVRELLRYYRASGKLEELRSWYGGYLFGNRGIYNPWSVVNYISKGCIPQAYWVNTAENEMIAEVLRTATDEITQELILLMQKETIITKIDQNLAYRRLTEDPSNIYSLLLVAGYLKTEKKQLLDDGSWLCEVSVPNREILSVYKRDILSHLVSIGALAGSTANRIAESLYDMDIAKFEKGIREYVSMAVSYFDTGAEGFYHGLVLGLVALTDSRYIIKSNRESGDGRYDISLIPREENYPGVIMELKSSKDIGQDELELLAEKALEQLEARHYDEQMREKGVDRILKLGIAFSGKRIAVKNRGPASL